MRQLRLVIGASEASAVKLRDVASRLHEQMSNAGRIQRISGPPERLRLLFPVHPRLIAMIRDDRAFAEELAGLATTYSDYDLTSTQADGYELVPSLTLGDIGRVQRLAFLTAACVALELSRHRDEPLLQVNSASPVYQSDDLLDELLTIALSPEAARQFRQLFRWPPEQPTARTGFDLQYRPLLEADHEWHVPIAVLATSNLPRAALMLTDKRPGTERPLIEGRLVKALTDAGHIAALGVKLRTGRQEVGEIDVVALVDDVLVVLECKNSLLPCNAFELRTSRDHCRTGASQLDRLQRLLGEPSHIESVLHRLGGTERQVSRVVTGVVVSNRLFAGLKIGQHPVISLGTFLGFIEHGTLNVAGQIARTRPDGRLTGTSVVEFLNGSFYTRIFGAMQPGEKIFACGGRRLRFRTYFLNFIELGRQFGLEVGTDNDQDSDAREGRDGPN
jgi:hypothetical protein